MKRNKQLTQSELCAFCQQIALVINAGLPIYYGVSILMEEAADPQTKELLAQIYTPMESGSTLHDAIKDTGVFPSYMIHMIRLGETTGHLEDVLESLSAYYEREAQIRAGIKSAAVYPLIMTALMLAVIFVMITKVVPVFTGIYEELGSELTGSARVLMHVSSVLNHYTTVVVIVFPIILVLCIILYHTELGRVLFQGTRLAMTIASGRVANCLHLVLSSGLDTDLGLDLAEELVGNPHMQAHIDKCWESIRQGETLDKALLLSGIFSQMYASWISIGYRTGDMDLIMEQICSSYEEDADEQISHILSLLEPTLVIILCFFVGLILISFLLPLLGILSSIG